MARTKNRLNCFCSRRPLLAMYGIDDRGRPYVHVKVYKQRRVFAEVLVVGGEVSLNCRECVRWHKIVFRSSSDGKAELKETSPPAEVDEQEIADDSANAAEH